MSSAVIPRGVEVSRRLAPDIYFPNFGEIAASYAAFNPLFIPEAEHVGDPRIPADAWLAFGRHRAIGFSPFSIDSLSGAEAERLGATYRLIGSFAPLLLDAQREGHSAGFAPVVAFDGTVDDAPQQATLGDYRFTVTFIDPWTPRAQQRTGEHGGLILQTGPEDYLVAGEGITVTVAPADGRGAAGIDSAWEGRFEDGAWRPAACSTATKPTRAAIPPAAERPDAPAGSPLPLPLIVEPAPDHVQADDHAPEGEGGISGEGAGDVHVGRAGGEQTGGTRPASRPRPPIASARGRAAQEIDRPEGEGRRRGEHAEPRPAPGSLPRRAEDVAAGKAAPCVASAGTMKPLVVPAPRSATRPMK